MSNGEERVRCISEDFIDLVHWRQNKRIELIVNIAHEDGNEPYWFRHDVLMSLDQAQDLVDKLITMISKSTIGN